MRKIIHIVGARPQFIKANLILKEMEKHNQIHPAKKIENYLLHTGQHYDDNLSRVFFEELGLPRPNINLGVGSATQGEQTGRMLEGVERVLLKEKPSLVVVYGDTNSTLAGALASSKLNIPVAHVEAGLRSYNKKMPEEINRVVTDHLSTLLFCPSENAVKNLEKEGIREGVYNTGDVMYDSFLYYRRVAKKKSSMVKELGLKKRKYFLVTIHRAENTDDSERLKNIFLALDKIAGRGMRVILPLHPRTQKSLKKTSLSPKIVLLPPVSYLDMLLLEEGAKVILTDSGGVQKEAYFSGVPCVTLREETEWVETVKEGWNVLVGTQPERIVRAAFTSSHPLKRGRAYGEGKATQQIVEILVRFIKNEKNRNGS